MYLIDTNIFLEILLKQEKSEECKKFLNDNTGLLNISDFSLHSIGIILFRHDEESTFQSFISDTLPKMNIQTLAKASYPELFQIRQSYNLDFDASYQYLICKSNSYELVTMDNDFKNIKDIRVKFL